MTFIEKLNQIKLVMDDLSSASDDIINDRPFDDPKSFIRKAIERLQRLEEALPNA